MFLAFAIVLVLSLLIASPVSRLVPAASVFALLAGFLLGPGVFGVIDVEPASPMVSTLAELALFTVLFTDGMHVNWSRFRRSWKLPGRVLGWGMPLTLLITALIAHYLVGLTWIQALLVGVILAPTDPVFAAALVNNKKVPHRLRHLLNVESGVNDGLALPVVVLFLAIASGSSDVSLGVLGGELTLGVFLGVAVPWLVLKLERTTFFHVGPGYEALNAVGIGMLVLALAKATHGNLFLAAFAAGITVATFGRRQQEAYGPIGDALSEALKLGAVLFFGALISFDLLAQIPWTGWVLAILSLVLARPVAVALSLVGSGIRKREVCAAAWFGPKGFASIVYGLMVLEWGVPGAEMMFSLIAVTIMISIIAHSSSDIAVARTFETGYSLPRWIPTRVCKVMGRPHRSLAPISVLK